MHRRLRDAFELEMAQARAHLAAGDDDAAFRAFERAHVLGQRWVVPHTRSHLGMLRVGWRRRDAREILGQLARIPGGIVGSAIGVIPVGNTGGANVSAFRPMAIPDDLQALLDADAP